MRWERSSVHPYRKTNSYFLCWVDSNGAETVTFNGELGSAVDDGSVTTVKSSDLAAAPRFVPTFFFSTITGTVLPAGDDKTFPDRRLRAGGVAAVWRTERGDTDSDISVNSMVVLSANDVSACRAVIVLRSASTAASFILDDFPIGKHDLSEFAVEVRCLRVRIIDPVVISSPKPSSWANA